MIALLIFFITHALIATDETISSVASKTSVSPFEARKKRARKKKEEEQRKHQARLEKARRRAQAKGLVPKTKKESKTEDIVEVEETLKPAVMSSFASEIEQIVNKYLKTSAQPTKFIDPDFYDVIWDETSGSLENVIKELESLEIELSNAVQKAKTFKTFTPLQNEHIRDLLLNVESFAEDTYQFDNEGNTIPPYSGVKKPYKTRLQALANNISNIKAELF